MQPVSESDNEESPPKQNLNLSPLPDRIGFIGAGQVLGAGLAHNCFVCGAALLDIEGLLPGTLTISLCRWVKL